MKSTYICSQRIDCVTPEDVYNFICQNINKRKKRILFAINLHTIVEIQNNTQLKLNRRRVDIFFADGVPLVWLSKLTKQPLPDRVSGTNFAEELLKNKRGDEFKIFLLGSTQSILQIIAKKYPHTVRGYYAPPFVKDEWSPKEQQKIISMINQSKANIVLVCTGSPKQELWLLHYFPKTKATVGISAGSALDILSGKTPRAPWFMKNYGLEWVWRIMLEPKRLGLRYLKDFFLLFRLIFKRNPFSTNTIGI